MAVWQLGDGTTVETGLRVTGGSLCAERIRRIAARRDDVEFLPHPSPGVPLDPDNDWLADVVIRQQAARCGVSVSSDYQPSDDDAPAEARELLRIWDENDASDDGLDSDGRPLIY